MYLRQGEEVHISIYVQIYVQYTRRTVSTSEMMSNAAPHVHHHIKELVCAVHLKQNNGSTDNSGFCLALFNILRVQAC